MYQIISFYKFSNIVDIESLRSLLYEFCTDNNIKGTIIIANEGINCSLSGKQESIKAFCRFLKNYSFLDNISIKVSFSNVAPFQKTKVKIKKEIIKFGVDTINMSKVGTYLNAKEWDELITKNDTIIIDNRNYYEYAIGTFRNAINPGIHHFSELAKWLQYSLKENDKKKNIAMFCTGGIRCEKSTAFLKYQGFDHVYQLRNGIIQYIEDNKNNKCSMWQGECFVFDDRIKY